MTPNADLDRPLKTCHVIYWQKLNTLEGGRVEKKKKKSLFSCLEADAPNL